MTNIDHMTTDFPVDEVLAEAIRWAEEYAPEIVANIEMIGAMLKRSQWKPIESAPKDGTTVLIHYTNCLGNGRTIKFRLERNS